MGCDMVGEGLLHLVPFITVTGSMKLTLRELVLVLLEPLRLRGWGALHGLARSVRGLQKVMHLAVFLKPPGQGM